MIFVSSFIFIYKITISVRLFLGKHHISPRKKPDKYLGVAFELTLWRKSSSYGCVLPPSLEGQFEFQLLYFQSSSQLLHLGGHGTMTQLFGPLSTKWETRVQFKDPGFGLQKVRTVNWQSKHMVEDLSVSLSLCLWDKQFLRKSDIGNVEAIISSNCVFSKI